MRITYGKIKKIALLYVTLPVLIFAIGWLQPIWAILLSATLIIVYLLNYVSIQDRKLHFDFLGHKNKEEQEEAFVIPVWVLVVIVLIAILWVIMSGIGGLWAQSKDFPWRNAIYRDIILRDWPVYYDKYGGALAYYIGLWLPPALIGKLSMLFGAGDDTAFAVGNIALMLWTAAGIMILFILIGTYLRLQTKKKILFAVLFFIFFSGMDILGSIEPLGANLYHIEWWANDYQYSSFTTCLFWVFNQSVIPWIVTMCIFQEKNVKTYCYLGMMCLFSGPMPFLGLFIYCIIQGVIKTLALCRDKQIKTAVLQIFSVSNILSAAVIFPITGSFLLCNDAIKGAGTLHMSTQSIRPGTVADTRSFTDLLVQYLLFVLFEFFIYALLIIRKNLKNPLYYTTVICLLIFPFIRIGSGGDFAMRASIPMLLALYLMCCRYIIDERAICKKEKGNKRLCYQLLIGALLIGSVTPGVEFYRGCRQVALRGLDNQMEDYIYTFGGDGPASAKDSDGSAFANFVTSSPKEQMFYQYFAKELDK